MRKLLILLLLAGTALPPAAATDAGETKIRLLSGALLARDQGDLATARKNLEELLRLAPNDDTVKRLLQSLEERTVKKITVTGGTVEAAQAAEIERLAKQEEERQERAAEEARKAARADPKAPDGPAQLADKGRSQYLAGATETARETLQRAVAANPADERSKALLARIEAEKPATAPDKTRAATSQEMLREVDRAWQRPQANPAAVPDQAAAADQAPMWDKLNRIMVPSVNFSGMELGRVVHTLGVISEEFDRTGTEPKGVNIVLIDPANANPAVSITLRNLPLKRVLDFITDSVGYQYEVQADAVVVRPGGEKSALDTRFFPVSRSTVLRMTGQRGAPKEPAADATTPAGSTIEQEGERIRSFLQLAGVTFDGIEGATLAFDGSQLIVTQTGRNLERIRNILARYSDVRQVEIEAKFMEVQQGALEELGVQWNLATKASQQNARVQGEYTTGGGINRTLSDAFRNATTNQQISVTGPGLPADGIRLDTSAPQIPGGVLLGTGASALANLSTIIGEFDVNAIVRALSQKSGTELLSAPKLTVLSGNPATITVAQELRYPQSYGEIQSQVGTGSVSGGGSAGVSITSGTPQEFTTRNVGVELRVTPTVEEDDRSVSLDLNPKVTEFEGFVEYGGPSIAISGGTTVTVPPGFYQPIFSVREVSTKVTIWDGATLVMGGLTREDVKKVNDKVPVFGSLPLVGRLFRSQGESTQKRNLLIFVTANLVSPGGSPKRQEVGGLPAGTLFQNPTIVTPSGSADRK